MTRGAVLEVILASGDDTILTRAECLGRGLIAERSGAVDRGEISMRANLDALVDAGLAGIAVPEEYGGHGAGPLEQLRVLEALAYGDGATPFVIAQHFGVAHMVAASDNTELRRAVLPRMASGDLLCGFGISQVRRQGRPAVTAREHDGGYRFDGTIPWMTGFGLFEEAVIAGTRSDGQSVLAWVPFAESAHMRFSAPMDLVAMNAARTVAATCDGLTVAAHNVVSIEPAARRARANATTVPCLFGIARACHDDLAALAERRDSASAGAAASALRRRLEALRGSFYDLVPRLNESASERALLDARAAATRLALDAAIALVVASGGGANARAHPAQRRLREVSVFATWGLSQEAANMALPVLSAG